MNLGLLMSEEIDRHVLRRFEICQKLGKGVSVCQGVCVYFRPIVCERTEPLNNNSPKRVLVVSRIYLNCCCCCAAVPQPPIIAPSPLYHTLALLSQAYGVVWKAIEKRTRQVLALKKCFDAFRNATDAQRTFREIMYLQALAGHDNLIRLQHVVKAENGRDIYLTFDHMGEYHVTRFIQVQILAARRQNVVCSFGALLSGMHSFVCHILCGSGFRCCAATCLSHGRGIATRGIAIRGLLSYFYDIFWSGVRT